ncbi:hypothetical protein J6590_102207 [Homalodisca vitripennis]|nr:hypothetical protein J6590_102207 [Homalodisca vitripennis]
MVVSGIWPLNPDIFTDADFMPSYFTDRPVPAHTVTAAPIELVWRGTNDKDKLPQEGRSLGTESLPSASAVGRSMDSWESKPARSDVEGDNPFSAIVYRLFPEEC